MKVRRYIICVLLDRYYLTGEDRRLLYKLRNNFTYRKTSNCLLREELIEIELKKE